MHCENKGHNVTYDMANIVGENLATRPRSIRSQAWTTQKKNNAHNFPNHLVSRTIFSFANLQAKTVTKNTEI